MIERLGVGPDRGGIGVGTGPVSLVLAAAIAVCVAVLSRQSSRSAVERPIV